MHLDAEPVIAAGEALGMGAQPVGPGAITLPFIPGKLVIDRRKGSNSHIGGLDNHPGRAITATRDPQIAYGGQLASLGFEFGNTFGRRSFRTVNNDVEEFVRQRAVVAELERLRVDSIPVLVVCGRESAPEPVDHRLIDLGEGYPIRGTHPTDTRPISRSGSSLWNNGHWLAITVTEPRPPVGFRAATDPNPEDHG